MIMVLIPVHQVTLARIRDRCGESAANEEPRGEDAERLLDAHRKFEFVGRRQILVALRGNLVASLVLVAQKREGGVVERKL